MFASIVPVALLALASGAQAVINTPTNLVTCQPSLLSWDASTGPYYVTVIPGGDPTGAPLANLGTFQTTSYTWNVNLAAGTYVTIALKDGTGAQLYSSPVTVSAGPDTSCVGQALASTGTAAGGSSLTPVSSMISTGVASSVSTSAQSAATSVASSVSRAAAASTTPAASASSMMTSGSMSASASSSGGIRNSLSGAVGSASGAVASASQAVTGNSGAGMVTASSGLVAAIVGAAGLALF